MQLAGAGGVSATGEESGRQRHRLHERRARSSRAGSDGAVSGDGGGKRLRSVGERLRCRPRTGIRPGTARSGSLSPAHLRDGELRGGGRCTGVQPCGAFRSTRARRSRPPTAGTAMAAAERERPEAAESRCAAHGATRVAMMGTRIRAGERGMARGEVLPGAAARRFR